jgi:hypothetical protein
MADLEARQIERQALQQRVDDLNSLVSALALPVGTAGALPISIDDLERSLPEARLTEDLYAMIEKITNDLGITNETNIGITQAAEPTVDQTIAETAVAPTTVVSSPVQITTRTSYDGAKQLLDRLTTTLRPLSISSVSMAPTDTGAIAVTINGTAYTRTAAAIATNTITTP